MITLEKDKLSVHDLSFVGGLYSIEVDGFRKIGRPIFDGKDESEVVAKLQYAFSIGGTPKEACNLADISTDSFYRYCRNHPEFRNKIELLQTAPTLLARRTIFQALLDGNVRIAMWYLERKRPEEFSVNASIESRLLAKDQEINYLKSLLLKNGISF